MLKENIVINILKEQRYALSTSPVGKINLKALQRTPGWNILNIFKW